jgi:two-component system, NarL family, nitrate/nitrite response regulator NarL
MMTTTEGNVTRGKTVSVMILEDQRMLGDALADIFQRAGIRVLAVSGNPEEVLVRVQQDPPDVLLVDLHLGREADGEEALGWRLIRKVHEWHPEIHVIVVTGMNDPQNVDRAYREGAHAFLDKNSMGSEAVVNAVLSVTRGDRMFPMQAGSFFGRGDIVQQPQRTPDPAPYALDSLTAREREVLRYVASGADNLKIAAMLAIAERTVRAHVSSLYRKMGAENRTQLALTARKFGVKPAMDI